MPPNFVCRCKDRLPAKHTNFHAILSQVLTKTFAVCFIYRLQNFHGALDVSSNELIAFIVTHCTSNAHLSIAPSLYLTAAVPHVLSPLCLHSKIMFVLQIGSAAQTDSCNVALDRSDTVDRAVLLQYSVNSGVSWHVVAQHQPKDFIKAQRVSYNIPL